MKATEGNLPNGPLLLLNSCLMFIFGKKSELKGEKISQLKRNNFVSASYFQSVQRECKQQNEKWLDQDLVREIRRLGMMKKVAKKIPKCNAMPQPRPVSGLEGYNGLIACVTDRRSIKQNEIDCLF